MAGKISMTFFALAKAYSTIVEAQIEPLHAVLKENGVEPIGGSEFWGDAQKLAEMLAFLTASTRKEHMDFFRKVLDGDKAANALRHPSQIVRVFKNIGGFYDKLNVAHARELKVFQAILAKGGTELADEYLKDPKGTLEKVAMEEVELH